MVSNPAALRYPPAFAGAGFDGFDLCTQTGSPESEKPAVFGRSDRRINCFVDMRAQPGSRFTGGESDIPDFAIARVF
jgi:hypothetical protein